MNKAKKLFALLLVAVFALAMSIPAFAAHNSTGSITIDGTTPGKTYDIYRIFDLTYDDSTPSKVAYTYNSDWVNFFVGGDGAGFISATNPGALNEVIYQRTKNYINITDANVYEVAQKALAYCSTKNPVDSKVGATGSTTITFSNLPLGYYLVFPQGASIKVDNPAGTPAWNSICSLTSTNPSATVKVKATYPTIEKTVDSAASVTKDVGDVATFEITGEVPDTTGYSQYTYKISDTMTEGLTFNKDVVVKFGSNTITDGRAASFTVDHGSLIYSVDGKGFTLSYDMTHYQAYVGQKISVTYTAKVNSKAVNTLTQNDAHLDYSNDPSNTNQTERAPDPDPVQVYTNKIDVLAHEQGNEAIVLHDAEFVLLNSDGKFYKYDPATDDVDWVDNEADASHYRTDSDGKTAFPGIADGTYTLRETAAPDGYNLVPDDITGIVAAHEDTANGPVGKTTLVKVPHTTGRLLPATGGVGTTIFFISGSVLLAAAVIVMITRKRSAVEA
ncbi:MAG: SpaH/EbpB family LPXTG-anchored major pilin [Oscillospiraceae bacterium]|nr:SpaH/EbpB family LPXTG-anchored major pilin [Oscillospiraceae bacterium]